MSKKKQFEYYDEFGQPVDRYGRAINPETGRPYEEEGDSAGQGTNHRTVRRRPPAPERASSRRPGKRNTWSKHILQTAPLLLAIRPHMSKAKVTFQKMGRL